MRLFFACFPSRALAAQLHRHAGRLRQQCGGRLVRTAQLHLTLAFLGDVDSARLDELVALAARQPWPALQLDLNRAGSFDTRVGWLAPGPEAVALDDWVRRFHAELALAGFHVEQHRFRPHLTLLRQLDHPLPLQTLPPLPWHLTRFALVESALTPHGATYRKRWEGPVAST